MVDSQINKHKTRKTVCKKPWFEYFHDGKSLFIHLSTLYCKCRSLKAYRRYDLFSGVHVGCLFTIGTNSSTVSSNLSLSLPALTWTFITLYSFLTRVIPFILGPTNETYYVNRTCRYFLLLCILSTGENKIIHTGIIELKSTQKQKTIPYDPPTYVMLAVCHLCMLSIVKKGGRGHSSILLGFALYSIYVLKKSFS